MSKTSKQSLAIKLDLSLESRGKAQVENIVCKNIEDTTLKQFDEDYENLGNGNYLLLIKYTDVDDLDNKIENLLTSIEEIAEERDCDISNTYINSMEDENVRWE